MPSIPRCLCAALAVLLAACGGGGGGRPAPGPGSGLPPGPGTFTAAPIDPALVTQLEPLGWINPPGGHTLPTDHVYFYYNGPGPNPPPLNPAPVLPVMAPGSGVVVSISRTGSPASDGAVMVRMTGTFSYELGHVIPDPNITVGATVSAGQRIGSTTPASGAVDFGVINEEITLAGFVNPARYPWATQHCDSPYRHFAEPLKSRLYAMVKRLGADRDGRIDYDVEGRLVGGWFHESLSVADSAGPAGWAGQIGFVPDPNDPSLPRVCLSSFLPMAGKFLPAPGTPAFTEVSVATGKVAYPLLTLESHTPMGLLIVQLEGEKRLRVQVFPGSTATDAEFDAASLVYLR